MHLHLSRAPTQLCRGRRDPHPIHERTEFPPTLISIQSWAKEIFANKSNFPTIATDMMMSFAHYRSIDVFIISVQKSKSVVEIITRLCIVFKSGCWVMDEWKKNYFFLCPQTVSPDLGRRIRNGATAVRSCRRRRLPPPDQIHCPWWGSVPSGYPPPPFTDHRRTVPATASPPQPTALRIVQIRMTDATVL